MAVFRFILQSGNRYGTGSGSDRVSGALNLCADVLVGCGVFDLQLARYGDGFGARSTDAYSVGEAAEYDEFAYFPGRRGFQRKPEVDVIVQPRVGRGHADDGGGRSVDAHSLPDY